MTRDLGKKDSSKSRERSTLGPGKSHLRSHSWCPSVGTLFRRLRDPSEKGYFQIPGLPLRGYKRPKN